MKKIIIALTLTAGIISFATPRLRADDQTPTTATDDGGGCHGSCHHGDKKHAPAPSPTP